MIKLEGKDIEKRCAATDSAEEPMGEVSRGSVFSKVYPLYWEHMCVYRRVEGAGGAVLMEKETVRDNFPGGILVPCLLSQYHYYSMLSILINDTV